jgi:hypothetical protein
MPPLNPPNTHLPPLLREVCAILARGILRLRSRAVTETGATDASGADQGESSLHFPPPQPVCANRRNRRRA